MNHIAVTIKGLDEVQYYRLLEELESIRYSGVEEKGNQYVVYIEEQDWGDEAQEVIRRYSNIESVEKVEERNWNEIWESNFEPVLIDDFCYIKAGFHPDRDGIAHTILITPKMSFGTGHHATTYQVIRMMRDLDFKGKKVLDFGTGTGILALLAERLGAAEVLAIDNDVWSVENTKENIINNRSSRVQVLRSSLDGVTGEAPFDIILANINRHILLEYMETMSAILAGGGSLLLSGILEEDVPAITARASEFGLMLISQSMKQSWVALLLGRHV